MGNGIPTATCNKVNWLNYLFQLRGEIAFRYEADIKSFESEWIGSFEKGGVLSRWDDSDNRL